MEARAVAIVTGGSQGIGRAIAETLTETRQYTVAIFDILEEAGSRVAERLCTKFGSGCCVCYFCDVTNHDLLADCYSRVEESLGKVTLVVNNAGILDEINWRHMMDVNTHAVIDLTYLAVSHMRRDQGGPGGTIVNVASAAALKSVVGDAVYAASKWAVLGFTQSMATSVELAEPSWGVSLLTLCPGKVGSPLFYVFAQKIQSPTVPAACHSSRRSSLHWESTLSTDEVAEACMQLIKDNKNGSVLRVSMKQGRLSQRYIDHTWSAVQLNHVDEIE